MSVPCRRAAAGRRARATASPTRAHSAAACSSSADNLSRSSRARRSRGRDAADGPAGTRRCPGCRGRRASCPAGAPGSGRRRRRPGRGQRLRLGGCRRRGSAVVVGLSGAGVISRAGARSASHSGSEGSAARRVAPRSTPKGDRVLSARPRAISRLRSPLRQSGRPPSAPAPTDRHDPVARPQAKHGVPGQVVPARELLRAAGAVQQHDRRADPRAPARAAGRRGRGRYS